MCCSKGLIGSISSRGFPFSAMSPSRDVAFEDDLFKRFVVNYFILAQGFNRVRKNERLCVVQMSPVRDIAFAYELFKRLNRFNLFKRFGHFLLKTSEAH